MPRFANVNWSVPITSSGAVETWEQVQLTVLMDIRDELQKLNAAIYCPNFIAIPGRLAEIERNTKIRRKVKRK